DAGCQTWWPTRQAVCGAAPIAGACRSVVSEAACSACGLEQYTEPCDDGLCPAGSECQPLEPIDMACQCGSGQTKTRCDGTPCFGPGPDCIGGDWSCQSTSTPTVTCTQEQLPASGHCVCADGRMPTFVCGETSSCEQRCSVGCDILAQDCPDAWAPKCTMLTDAGVPTVSDAPLRDRLTCVPVTGNKLENEPCTRSSVGFDDCAKGLFCATTSGPDGGTLCRKLCHRDTDCAG